MVKGKLAHYTTGYGLAMDSLQILVEAIRKLSPSNFRAIEELTGKLLALQSYEQTYPLPAHAAPLPELEPLIATWITHLQAERKSPQTIKLYLYHVRELLAAHPQPSREAIEVQLSIRSGSGVGAQAIANRVYAYRSFFSYLHDTSAIPSDPTFKLAVPRVPRREREIPTPYHLARLLAGPLTTDRDRALILLLIGSGLRISEAMGIRISDLDLAPRTTPDPATEQPQVTSWARVTVIGKGDKQRTVPLSQTAALTLLHYKNTLSAGALWLFPGVADSHQTYRSIDARMGRLCQAAQIPRITPHHLRHFYTSVHLNRGTNLKVLSRILGHAGPDVTARVYWHLLDASEIDLAATAVDPIDTIPTEEAP